MGKSKRDSNIEACRIVCMLMIIAHHCVAHGGACAMNPCINKYISWFILPGGKFCFDAFLAISAWFLVDQTFKSERFFRIWGMVLFYSVIFSIISVAMGTEFSWQNWFSVFFPIGGNSHGFAASYLAFYLLIPFLTMISKNVTKKQAKWLVLLLIYFQVISQIIGTVSGYTQPISSELLLFVLCYFIALYLKHYTTKEKYNRLFLICVILLLWIGIFVLYYWNIVETEENVLRSIMLSLCKDESSILYLLGGFAIFIFFYSIKMPKIWVVNRIAGTTFGILLMHDHNFFRYVLWNNILHTQEWLYDKYFVVKVLLSVGIIFVVGSVIELIRQKFIEKPIFSTKWMQKAICKFDDIVNETLI